MADESTIQGTVQRVVHRGQSGWVVARVACEDRVAPVSVVGAITGIAEGAVLRLTGQWEEHPRFGQQFRARWATTVVPETAQAMERFLASGLVEGIGPVMAKRLVGKFGADTLEVIDKQAHRLCEVEGIGPGRAGKIVEAWGRHQGIREVMFFLQSHGVGTAHAHRILREFGATQAVPTLTANPYSLAERIRGIGFQTADRIARNLGFDAGHPARLEAGLLHVVREATGEGHCALPRELLLEQVSEVLLGAGDGGDGALADLQVAMDRLALGGRVVVEDSGHGEWVYEARLHGAEERVAKALRTLVARRENGPPPAGDAQERIAHVERVLRLPLDASQRDAVAVTLRPGVSVVTGGPGTGKTTVVQAIVQVHRQVGARVVLAAPTGRAANRLQEATGRPASTLHRLLEFAPREGKFQRNEERPLDADVVVVDEASMVDLPLVDHLLKAVPLNATLVLVGDANQLPSVGPGRVLADIIASGLAAVVALNQVYRQASDSLILDNAHRILAGQAPLLPAAGSEDADFYFFEREDPEDVLQTVVRLVSERIPQGFALDPLADIQVLTPMHKGTVGAQRLNEALQQALNPQSPAEGGAQALQRGSVELRVGDKVMQVRNDYELNVFNGDIGRITYVDPAQQQLGVVLDGRTVIYEARHLDSLRPAYAVSIHKSQGSEYPAVVVPLHTQHWIMLRRDLLYTAVTRGKRLVILVGNRKALERAVRNGQTALRYTGLARRLSREGQSS